MDSKKILVTGGAGAIGSALVRKLSEDHSVTVLDDLSSGYIENLRGIPVNFRQGSIVDREILEEVFDDKPSIVFHLAANFANQNSIDYPLKDLNINGMGTLLVLQQALKSGVERFIYSSSSCIYGNRQELLSENIREYSVKTPYAMTKLMGEQYVNFFHNHHDMPTVILRLFNSYGPGEYPGKYRNVIPNFVSLALLGKSLMVTGTGKETRDFNYVMDTVEAMLLSMQKEDAVGMTFNVGSGKDTPIIDLAESIIEVCGVKVPIEYKPQRNWDDVMRRCADISLIRDTLGYEPATDLSDGLKSTYEWFIEKNINDYEFI